VVTWLGYVSVQAFRIAVTSNGEFFAKAIGHNLLGKLVSITKALSLTPPA